MQKITLFSLTFYLLIVLNYNQMTQKSYRKERRPFDKLRDLGELRSGSRRCAPG